MKNTVTDSGASVASPSSIDEALESGILPRDPHFLKTGRFAKDEAGADEDEQLDESGQEEQDENEEHDEQDSAASGEQDGENAAASQAAESQNDEADTGRRQTRSRGQGESRWAKLSRENRELRERIARVEGQHGAAADTRESSQASQPAAAAAASTSKGRPEPKIDDVDAAGKPKYADYEAWQRDLRKWDREEAVREFSETNAQSERERQQREAQETISREWTNRVVSAEKDMPDFREVALDTSLPIKAGSLVDVFVLDSPVGPKVLYHLAKNREELERIQGTPVYDAKGLVIGFRGGLNPVAQARELTKIELKLSGSSSSSSSARPVTQAPRPPHQVSGKGTVAKDAASDAVEHQDQRTYATASNERDPRLLAVRRSRGK